MRGLRLLIFSLTWLDMWVRGGLFIRGTHPPWNVVMKPTLVLFPAVRVWRRPLSFDFVSGPALPGRVLVTKGSQRKFPPSS